MSQFACKVNSYFFDPANANTHRTHLTAVNFLTPTFSEISLTLAGRFPIFAAHFGALVKTYLAKKETVTRNWRIIDAEGKILGRLAVRVADALRGKDKPTYTPHVDAGDFVVVINAEKVRVTGKKESDKEYMTYSGWKGGEKYRSVEWIRARNPELLVTRAVKGMLPKNKLGKKMLTKLKVYRGAEHPHTAQKPAAMKLAA